jgi:DNA-binding transcriptional MocR family regulator
MSGTLAPAPAVVHADLGSERPEQLDTDRIRQDFPVLQQRVHGHPLVYLDNAATAQKPQVVIDAVSRFYSHENANIHRGVHYLSGQASAAYDLAREKVARFINARAPHEVVFTRGTTDSINLVAQSFGRSFLKAGDEILISRMEHHSNIVPWQLLCEQTGAVLRAAPLSSTGELDLDAFQELLSDRTRLIALVRSNRSPAGPESEKCRCWWTLPNRLRTLVSMCRTWTAISWRSLGTSSMGQRESEYSTAGSLYSSGCHLIRVAAG